MAKFEANLARLEQSGAPGYVIDPGPASAAVDAEARRLGLVDRASLPAMLALPTWLDGPGETGAAFEHVTTPRDALRLIADGFATSLDVAGSLMNERFLALEEVDLYLARVGGEPVSTATTIRTGDGAGIYAVATPAAHRGRGYGGAVTAHAVREAFGRGAPYAYLQASAMGLPVYRRLGFTEPFRFTVFSRPAEP